MELVCVFCREEFFSEAFSLHCCRECLHDDLEEASLVIHKKAAAKARSGSRYNPHHEKLYGEGETHG